MKTLLHFSLGTLLVLSACKATTTSGAANPNITIAGNANDKNTSLFCQNGNGSYEVELNELVSVADHWCEHDSEGNKLDPDCEDFAEYNSTKHFVVFFNHESIGNGLGEPVESKSYWTYSGEGFTVKIDRKLDSQDQVRGTLSFENVTMTLTCESIPPIQYTTND